jgi:hypothetical protein
MQIPGQAAERHLHGENAPLRSGKAASAQTLCTTRTHVVPARAPVYTFLKWDAFVSISGIEAHPEG